MIAILRRELKSYFSSPLGYIILALIYFIAGFFFKATTLASGTTDLTYVFTQMFTIVLIIVPLLTMRLLSEDKKLKTDQLLLTSPISLSGLVIGKFLSAFILYALGICITFVYAVVLVFFAPAQWPTVFGNLFGLLLLGASLVSVGLLVSSLTENQFIAAIVGYVVMFMLMMLDSFAAIIPIDFLSKAVSAISFYSKYTEFTSGIVSVSGVLFFISATVIFLFLTTRVLEKKRWG